MWSWNAVMPPKIVLWQCGMAHAWLVKACLARSTRAVTRIGCLPPPPPPPAAICDHISFDVHSILVAYLSSIPGYFVAEELIAELRSDVKDRQTKCTGGDPQTATRPKKRLYISQRVAIMGYGGGRGGGGRGGGGRKRRFNGNGGGVSGYFVLSFVGHSKRTPNPPHPCNRSEEEVGTAAASAAEVGAEATVVAVVAVGGGVGTEAAVAGAAGVDEGAAGGAGGVVAVGEGEGAAGETSTRRNSHCFAL